MIDTIMQKMQKELEQAKKYDLPREKLTQHITKIHLLCELILEDSPSATSEQNEIKKIEDHKIKMPNIDHDEANGPSIFDF